MSQANVVILAATDMSPEGDEAVRQADTRARARAARLVVCHAHPDPVAYSPLLSPALASIDLRAMREDAARALRERVAALTGRGPDEVDTLTPQGAPHRTIVEEGKRVGAELVVVGSHGRTGVARVVLGSVAERVVRHSPCPVLVARQAAKTGRVVVATDFSDPALPAVRAAWEEAQRVRGTLTALHCIDLSILDGMQVAPGATALAFSESVLDGLRSEARERLARALADVGATGDTIALDGAPQRAIVEAAAKLDAELIVVGTAGRTGLDRFMLGSVAEAVVRTAPCSVLVVRLGG